MSGKPVCTVVGGAIILREKVLFGHLLVAVLCPPTLQQCSAQFEITQELQQQTVWNLQMCIHSTAMMQVEFESQRRMCTQQRLMNVCWCLKGDVLEA